MMEWRVTWTIEVDADDPWTAAERALLAQRDPASTATVFDVTATSGVLRDRVIQVDLEHAALIECESCRAREQQYKAADDTSDRPANG